jgi:hypothetical protein
MHSSINSLTGDLLCFVFRPIGLLNSKYSELTTHIEILEYTENYYLGGQDKTRGNLRIANCLLKIIYISQLSVYVVVIKSYACYGS